MRWIDVGYKCKCMPAEATFQVRERAHDEDIVEYMDHMRDALAADHRKRSPLCMSEKTEYVKVPVGDGILGGAEGGTA